MIFFLLFPLPICCNYLQRLHSQCIDEKTKEEFLSWMRAFPHLRVVGKKMELPPRQTIMNEYVDEMIAIDPPRYEGTSFRLLDQELNEKLSLRKSRQLSGKNDNLEKLLRITSSGLNRNPNQRLHSAKKSSVDRVSTYVVKQSSLVPTNHSSKRLSQIRERDIVEQEKLSYSASNSTRIGPLLNVKFLYKKPEVIDSNVKSIKSASSKLPLYELMSLDKTDHSSKSASIHSKNPNIIQLPPFNYELDFPIIQGRSIQSAVGKSARILKH